MTLNNDVGKEKYETQINLKYIHKSVTNKKEFLQILKNNPGASIAIIDGSFSNSPNEIEYNKVGHGVGIIGYLNKIPLLISRRGFARRKTPALRLQTHALLFILRIARYHKVEHLYIFTDCDYVANTYTQEWYKRWFNEKKSFSHLNLWNQIFSLKKVTNKVIHLSRNAFPLHTYVDNLAKRVVDINKLSDPKFDKINILGFLMLSINNINNYLKLLVKSINTTALMLHQTYRLM